MAKIGDVYGGNYLQADDLQGRAVNVTIESAEIKEFEGKKKFVLTFAGKDKRLIVNVTNANALEAITGSDDSDDWIGHRICLYVDKNVMFQGKRTPAIRIKAAMNGARPEPAPPPPPVEELGEDEIPF